ncbi:MAG: hypothetical protein KME32_34720 [Mojavia pulchra JT2-VF2]|jgi:hypothetical protein|uniref:Uncharacterized protein n=1 Tax=Mojavia pulchra JT2-VF2 TaxID=287848 RepID=A0A951Q4Y8_9NOST|nr:hypothetical protein [Mojavia pulchra JT2-VF2]
MLQCERRTGYHRTAIAVPKSLAGHFQFGVTRVMNSQITEPAKIPVRAGFVIELRTKTSI